MNGNIAVIYEQGMLRPLHPLNLPDHTKLEIRIVNAFDEETTNAGKAYRALYQAGLVQADLLAHIDPIPEIELQRAADAFGQVGSLSTVIIAERNEA